MFNFAYPWFIVTAPTLKYKKVLDFFFSKADSIMTEDEMLCKSLNFISQHVINQYAYYMPNSSGEIKSYVCHDKCYLKLSPNLTIDNHNKTLLAYSFDMWSDKKNHESEFLIPL